MSFDFRHVVSLERSAVLSLRKLCFFATVATVGAFAAAGTVNCIALKGKAQAGSLLPVQSRDVKSLGVGKLLVASRGLGDPSFAETVILLVHYDAQSVVGLVLNRRTNFPLSRVLSDFKAARNRSDAAYRGGPVETTTVLALYRPSAKIDGVAHVFDKVYLIASKPVFEQILAAQPDPDVFRVYLGYAGWNRDQLQREVELGMWFIFPADTKVVFSSDPDSLWRQMIGKTEPQFADNYHLRR